jgi:hypothetical protein
VKAAARPIAAAPDSSGEVGASVTDCSDFSRVKSGSLGRALAAISTSGLAAFGSAGVFKEAVLPEAVTCVRLP